MVSDILSAVSRKLNSGFKIPVYGDEQVSQGMKRPCFFVCLTEAAEESLPSGRVLLRAPLDIVYFPKIAGSYTEMRKIGQELFDLLQVFTLSDGSLIRGRGRKFDIIDGALHFFIGFNLHLLPVESEEDRLETLMRDLDLLLELD